VRFVAVASFAGLVGFAVVSANAAPLSPKSTPIEVGANPSIELARDGCGRGWHRTGWRDQWGRWQWGDCIPDGDPYRGRGAGWYSPPSYWRGTPPPWGWSWVISSAALATDIARLPDRAWISRMELLCFVSL
jgi:hypothetical protein